AVEVVGEFALVPDMISGGEHVDAEIEKLLGDLRGEAEATGGILSVGNAEIDAVLPEQRRKLLAHNRPPWPSENISDKQNLQAGSLEKLPSRSCYHRELRASELLSSKPLHLPLHPTPRRFLWKHDLISQRPRPACLVHWLA